MGGVTLAAYHVSFILNFRLSTFTESQLTPIKGHTKNVIINDESTARKIQNLLLVDLETFMPIPHVRKHSLPRLPREEEK